MSAPPASIKIEELESVRGLAALLIVVYHIPRWNEGVAFGLLQNAYLMVLLFFVLSGFVINNAYAAKLGTPLDLFRFVFLRFGRLYPVHLLFLLLFLLVEVAKYFAQQKFGISSPNTQPFRENSVAALFQQLLLIQAIGPTGNTTTFNGPAWSISVEFYTYVLFGFILLFCGRLRRELFLFVAVASAILVAIEATFGFSELLRCTAGFFLGCLVAEYAKFSRRRYPKWLVTVLFVAIVLFLQWKSVNQYDLAIYFLTALLVISIVQSEDSPGKRLLRSKALTWLGKISYSMYMSHFVIEWFANQTIRVVMKRPERSQDGWSVPTLSLGETIIAYGLVVLVVLFVSHWVFRLVEQPLRERSRKFAFSRLMP